MRVEGEGGGCGWRVRVAGEGAGAGAGAGYQPVRDQQVVVRWLLPRRTIREVAQLLEVAQRGLV